MTRGRIHPVQEPFILRWGPALLVMVTIFAFSATPGDDLPRFGLVDLLVKKGVHFAGYALLALACLRGFGDRTWNTASSTGRHSFWLAFGLTLAYALTDELHQVFTPGRHPSLLDVGVDAVGAALALLISAMSARLRGWVTFGVKS